MSEKPERPNEERYQVTRPDGEKFATAWKPGLGSPLDSPLPLNSPLIPPKPVEPVAEDPWTVQGYPPIPGQQPYTPPAKPSLWQRVKNWFNQ